MDLNAVIEQAVYTSARTSQATGYQLVVQSPGVCAADARALAAWGPSHDSLIEAGPEAVSVNFHSLPSGTFCVSRTTAAGWEYSGRGGHRVYTHCLIVPAEVLARFANNPFAVARAALAAGAMQEQGIVPRRLEALELPGGANAVDEGLLARLADLPGPEAVARLIQTARAATRLAVAGPPSPEQLIEGLLVCLPSALRTEFSFTTGLKYSSRRPFRIVALHGDRAQRAWTAHQPNMMVLDVSEPVRGGQSLADGWARFIERVLASGKIAFLADQLAKRRSQLSGEDLPALGLQLLEELESRQLDAAGVLPARREREEQCPGGEAASSPTAVLQRAHAAHRRFEKSAAAKTAGGKRGGRRRTSDAESPEVVEKLEQLDDVVYDAIGGQPAAIEELHTLWPQILAELGEDLVAESREQYLRYGLSIWEDCATPTGIRNPTRAIQALEVLCLLFNDL